MLGSDCDKVGWPACGEIDIMEYVGYEPGVVHANIHTKAYNHVQKTNKQGSEDLHRQPGDEIPRLCARVDAGEDGLFRRWQGLLQLHEREHRACRVAF
jgi:hypothetical protein